MIICIIIIYNHNKKNLVIIIIELALCSIKQIKKNINKNEPNVYYFSNFDSELHLYISGRMLHEVALAHNACHWIAPHVNNERLADETF